MNSGQPGPSAAGPIKVAAGPDSSSQVSGPPPELIDFPGGQWLVEQVELLAAALVEQRTVLHDHTTLLVEHNDAINRGVFEPVDPQADLAAWVDWLAVTYALASELTGWESHPALVNELTALRKAHRAAYMPKAPAAAAVSWHETLARFIPRVHEYSSRASKNGSRRTVTPGRGQYAPGTTSSGDNGSDVA